VDSEFHIYHSISLAFDLEHIGKKHDVDAVQKCLILFDNNSYFVMGAADGFILKKERFLFCPVGQELLGGVYSCNGSDNFCFHIRAGRLQNVER
jgi:hypothetical protein